MSRASALRTIHLTRSGPLAGGGCPPLDTTTCEATTDPHAPITCVTSFEAQSYCEWAGKDLPRDEQWMRAEERVPKMPRRLHQELVGPTCLPLDPWCGVLGWAIDGFREELDGLGLFSEPVQGSSPHVELADAVRRDPANLIGLFQRSGPPVKVEIGLGELGAGGHVGRLELDDPP